MQKKPFQKDLIPERHLPKNWDAYLRKEKRRKANLSNWDLIKFLTDEKINKHSFLVINMHHEKRQLSIVDEYEEWFYPAGEIGHKLLCITKIFGLCHVFHK